jgi:hypothetical protein
MMNGLNPDKAEDSYTVTKYGVAWWDARPQEWVLDEGDEYYTKEAAQDEVEKLNYQYQTITHKAVKITKQISYEEV